jgi:hypothetical protein
MAYKRVSPVPVVEGGTGAQTLTSHGVLLGNTTSAVTATTAGTTGQVLTGVTGSAPTFQAPAASSISITGDSGGTLTGAAFTFTGASTGLTFAGAGSTETLGGTLAIANGGTNATSFTQSNGIVTYNGTRLVNYAGPQINSSGVATNTTQPAFLAYLASEDINVTGAGTAYTFGTNTALTEAFDQGSDFSGTTFTAPVTAKYQLGTQMLVIGCTTASTFNTRIVTSNRTYFTQTQRVGSALNFNSILNVMGDMDIADTAYVTVQISGEAADTDDLTASAGTDCWFYGALIC